VIARARTRLAALGAALGAALAPVVSALLSAALPAGGAALRAAGGAGAGCGCTADSRVEGFNVTLLSADGGEPPDGDYHIAVDADGARLALDLTLENGEPRCGGSSFCWTGMDFYRDVDVELDINNAALGPTIVRIRYTEGAGGPRFVEIRVSQDDVLIGEAIFRPEYERTSVEGELCGDILTASDDMTLTIFADPGLAGGGRAAARW
jgi:hypothetical protein